MVCSFDKFSKSRWPLSIIIGVIGAGIAIAVVDTDKPISVVTKAALCIIVTVMISSITVSSSINLRGNKWFLVKFINLRLVDLKGRVKTIDN